MPDTASPHSSLPVLLVGVLVSLLLGACRGTGEKERDAEPYVPAPAPAEDSIGYFLVQYDKGLERWAEIKLGPRGAREESLLRTLESSLRELAVKRRDELLSELVTGSPKNREVAVVALGFTGEPVVLGPLLQALADPAPAVVQKTHLALGILGFAETPLDPITADLLGNPEPWTRNNAAFAVHRIVAAGGRMEGLERVLVSALSDPEPGVRAQAASTLGILAEPSSIDAVAPLLVDPVALVSRAAAATLGAIARAHPESSGACARSLAVALANAPESARPGLIDELALMRGGTLGEDPAAWRDWASRLP